LNALLATGDVRRQEEKKHFLCTRPLFLGSYYLNNSDLVDHGLAGTDQEKMRPWFPDCPGRGALFPVPNHVTILKEEY